MQLARLLLVAVVGTAFDSSANAQSTIGDEKETGPRRTRITFAEVLRREDANNDGKVVKEEFEGPPRLFERLDRNGDNVLSAKDFADNTHAKRPRHRVPSDVEILRDVTFGRGGERELKMHIVMPKKPSKEPMPAYVWIHGGGWQGGSKEGGLQQVIPLVQRGFVGATIEYRLSGEATFPAQIEDCKCAIRYLRAHADKYYIDTNRIAVGGGSAGGHLAALVGTSGGVDDLEGSGGWNDQSSQVHAVVDVYGPTDFATFVTTPGYESHARRDSPESKLLGGEVLTLSDAMRRVNPITYIDSSDPPFLIIHGDSDRTVPLNQSELMHKALQSAGVTSRLHIIKGAGHGGAEFFQPAIRDLKTQFLVKTLNP